MIKCEKCGKEYQTDVTPLYCSCSHTTNAIPTADPPSYYTRKELCSGCKYRTPKGCALYIKPCTVKRLWHDQIDPPTLCPKKTEFEE